MTKQPPQWDEGHLAVDAAASVSGFRTERLAASDAWATQVEAARRKFDLLFQTLGNLTSVTDETLEQAYGLGLGEALRYLAGPPISDDDLKIIAEVESLKPNALKHRPGDRRKVFDVIERVLDSHRFPWVVQGTAPSQAQREAALLASAVLLASQRVATERRNDGKARQEEKVKGFLREAGFAEVAPSQIRTLVQGPQTGQFCAECLLGERKADVVVRLFDTRLLAIECKVSNSATNSVKRLNNDAAVKAEYWLKQFGASQVVPVAVLSGVFNVLNLSQAQQRGLALFWSHDLDSLGEFIESTR